MSDQPLRDLIRGLRGAVGPHEAGGLTDADLLQRWVANRDGAAFEVLLWRHGPLVLGLCRRLLRGSQDVEDAFQSTFLALARQAGSLSKREAVACWLHKVAYRAALRARAATGRWRALDREVADTAADDPLREMDRDDLRAILDEEVSRLPDCYRAPLVLCYFEGRTNEEAARALGCPVGTVASRLARGRQRLRVRLARRGLAPAAGLFALSLAREAAAVPLPTALVAATARVALLGAGSRAIQGVLSARVVALTEGVLRTMRIAKMKMVTAVVLAVAVAGAGGSLGYKAVASGQADRPAAVGPRAGGGGPLKAPPAVVDQEREAKRAEAQAAVEEAQADLATRLAQLAAAQATLKFNRLQLARFEDLVKQRAIEERLVEEKREATVAAEAAVRVAEAQVAQGQVRLKAARRRLAAFGLSALESVAPPPRVPGKLNPEQRLSDLERKLDALRKEVADLRRELRRKEPGAPSRP